MTTRDICRSTEYGLGRKEVKWQDRARPDRVHPVMWFESLVVDG